MENFNSGMLVAYLLAMQRNSPAQIIPQLQAQGLASGLHAKKNPPD
jgi:hypothetical protein